MRKKALTPFHRSRVARPLLTATRHASLPTAAAFIALGLGGLACRARSEAISADDPANEGHAPAKPKATATTESTGDDVKMNVVSTPPPAPQSKQGGSEMADIPIAAPKKLPVAPAVKPTSTVRPPIAPKPEPIMLDGDVSSVRVTHPFGVYRIA